MQIKLRTAIAMATRMQEIKSLHRKHGFIKVCFEYEGAVTSACTNGAFSCGWNLIAAAVALNQPITSVFPLMNTQQVVAYNTLNTTTTPRHAENRVPIYIHLTGGHVVNGYWQAIHFVPLMSSYEVHQHPVVTIDDSDDDWPSLTGRSTYPYSTCSACKQSTTARKSISLAGTVQRCPTSRRHPMWWEEQCYVSGITWRIQGRKQRQASIFGMTAVHGRY